LDDGWNATASSRLQTAISNTGATGSPLWDARASANGSASRIPAPTPPTRVARRGLLVALLGAVIIALASGSANEGVHVLGVGVMVTGMLMAVPLLVATTGRLAARLPLPLRLAACDTARHGRRAGAAVAGAALALALPVGRRHAAAAVVSAPTAVSGAGGWCCRGCATGWSCRG
jgi:putative ABC transport system permease protein